MKKVVLFLWLCSPLWGIAQQGIPFFVNYASEIYHAHNRNFDVACDKWGNVYIANFEGIIHYDYNRWEVLYTPGYSRVTRLYTDTEGRIWIGGYHIVGWIDYDKQGRAALHTVVSDLDKNLEGEVEDLMEEERRIYVRMTTGKCYVVQSDSLLLLQNDLPEAVREKWKGSAQEAKEIYQTLYLPNGWKAEATLHRGIVVYNEKGEKLFSLSEQNGLCSNTVMGIAADERGNLWGATDNGIFRVSLPSPFSRYTALEGLKGEVVSIIRYKGILYAGTLQGLYFLERNRWMPVKEVHQACWELQVSPRGLLYAATSDGVFQISAKSQAREVVGRDAFTVAFLNSGDWILGTVDGIYRYDPVKQSTKEIASIEKVVRITWQKDSTLLVRTLYGEKYLQKSRTTDFMRQPEEKPEPEICYTDREGYGWQTDIKGKKLQVTHTRLCTEELNCCLNAVRNDVIRVIYVEENEAAWLGGDFGLIRVDLPEAKVFPVQKKPELFFREMRLNQDSVYSGGYFTGIRKDTVENSVPLFSFGSDTRTVSFSFATDAACFTGNNEYRFRLEGEEATWSTWGNTCTKEYANLSSGTYCFQVQARDIYGRESEVKQLSFLLLPPFYLKWYCLVCYGCIFAALLWALFKWRMHKLLREKERLEFLVSERTRQLVKQKEEIEEKSEKLEEALKELGQAQNDLVRQEKMATVGKLTQGLIDRILNPLNYINNFTHLTAGLLRDLQGNLEKERERIEEENYADSADVAKMMAANLEKIEEHGANTTRILKAMEEILKNRTRQLERVDLAGLCRKTLELLNNYYREELSTQQITVSASLPADELFIQGNAEQLSKTLMSLLVNSMYALGKKYHKKAYSAELRLEMLQLEGQAEIHIRDNGIGIEPGILEKIFDPFFTTKTTGEAAGIGLYLSKEIILNHRGQISVRSEKDSYTEFVILLPLEGYTLENAEGNNH